MAGELDRPSDGNRGVPAWVLVVMAILGIVAVVGLVVAYNATTEGQGIQQSLENKLKAQQTDLTGQVAQLQKHLETADAATAGLQSDFSVVTKKLSITQADLKKARAEAADIKAAEEQKIAEMNGAVTTQLATKASTDEVKTVDNKVAGVRTDLDSTKNDLKMARSELGTLIARDHNDIEQLRRLGERDYTEFTIDGKDKPQRIGSITVELRKANLKKKISNVVLTINDVPMDKKNLPVNEPVFFQQGGERRPCEFVINTVAKDKITGYVSVPKPGAQNTSGN